MHKMKGLVLAALFFVQFVSGASAEKTIFDLQGTYLAYSYDYNLIYGESVEFISEFCILTSDYFNADIPSRLFIAIGNIILTKEGKPYSGDEFIFDPVLNKGTIIRYKNEIEIEEIGDQTQTTLSTRANVFNSLNLTRIKKSVISFTGQHFEITENYDVFGYEVTLHIEGLESVGLKKVKLSEGIRQNRNGPYLDKIWYNKAQGITAQAGLLFKKENTINSLTKIYYEEHSILKDYVGLKRQVDLMTSTSLTLGKDVRVGITGNINSSKQWNTRFSLNKNWGQKGQTQVDFTYNKPINRDSEAWLGMESFFDGGKLGRVSLAGKYELQDQVLANFAYSNLFLKKINLQLNSSYSKLRVGDSSDYSKILTGNARLSYESKVFNLATDYYLNHDLFGQQLLSQPQLRFGLKTFRFYDGLLSASLSNVFIYNTFSVDEFRQKTYSNNTIFNLSSQPIYVQKSLSLNFNIALEQFLEKEGRNFTSAGFVLNARQSIAKGITLEGFYSVRSRRKSENLFIEGTTSQDLSTVLRVNPIESINSWVSISYDPKNGQWRQSFTDVSITFFKAWTFHSQLNYDFLQKKINNIDLYLIRDSGRIQIRLIWRSLSKQFLIELVPK